MFIRRLFNVTAAALLIWGGFLLTRVAHSIGRVYGGFIVIHDLTQEPPFYVGYFPWRTVRSAPFFLQAEDHLLSIQGLPPEAYPTIYAAAQPGEPIEYVVERRGQILTIVEPAYIFSADAFVAVFGMIYLLMLIALLTGYVLLRSPCPPYRRILALLCLLPAAAMMHTLWAMDNFDGPSATSSYWFWLFGAPIPGLGGAMALHSLLLYPQPQGILARRPWLASLLYAPPLLIGIVVRILTEQGTQARPLFSALFNTVVLYGILCVAATFLVGILRFPSLQRSQRLIAWKSARSLLLALSVLLLALILIWWAPYLLSGGPLIPYEILIAMGVTYPLGLAYAIFHSNLLVQAERKTQEAEALRRAREQMLHRIAARLHDRLLPELQGIRMMVEALQIAEKGQAQQDRLTVAQTLHHLAQEIRSILDTTEPIDWSRHSLLETFTWMAQRMASLHPNVRIHLAVEDLDAKLPPPVKEALYHVAMAALNNALAHAQPNSIWLRLHTHPLGVHLEVEDDGVGFLPDFVHSLTPARRHMGLEAMRIHAAEVSGHLSIESNPGKGTLVKLDVPLDGV
ncbi:MAG: hypothetical protein KatS3mg109_2298 [Pirellulaceae bacterium]|uniref:sensor histidine kinase n=1 Tax=Caldilinea sp. TaxID=2293560 RepID=UPI0021DB86F1|nr:ATP-binding protein [uncultured Caldilinea sp.]GIW91866.1 MAG: hypothetical protein KatS3mg109_2298 [Pirellulaceae bacterium]